MKLNKAGNLDKANASGNHSEAHATQHHAESHSAGKCKRGRPSGPAEGVSGRSVGQAERVGKKPHGSQNVPLKYTSDREPRMMAHRRCGQVLQICEQLIRIRNV